MHNIEELKNCIALCLYDEKSYNLPSICEKYGLASGTEEEAHQSKRPYVLSRLKDKNDDFIIHLIEKLIKDYDSSDFFKMIEPHYANELFAISSITRIKLQENYLLEIEFKANTYNDISYLSDKKLIKLFEDIVHPKKCTIEEQKEIVSVINNIIVIDGFLLEEREELSGRTVFQVIKLKDGVKGHFKNLIFSADGPKPEIVLSDLLNNNIQIIKNEEYCLIYDKAIPKSGLFWHDLVNWWKGLSQNKQFEDLERELYSRLYKSLDSQAEQLFFKIFFKKMRDKFKEKLPALIPQVYLHYDPYTLKNLKNQQRIPRQRMDFLLLLPNNNRIVIEIDGKQHYSNGDKSSPKLYSEMVSADRELKLKGYEIYRFGGYELTMANNKEKIVEDFFDKLFEKYM